MEKKYAIKEFHTGNYYTGSHYSSITYITMLFDTIEAAEQTISEIGGYYTIETVYIA